MNMKVNLSMINQRVKIEYLIWWVVSANLFKITVVPKVIEETVEQSTNRTKKDDKKKSEEDPNKIVIYYEIGGTTVDLEVISDHQVVNQSSGSCTNLPTILIQSNQQRKK